MQTTNSRTLAAALLLSLAALMASPIARAQDQDGQYPGGQYPGDPPSTVARITYFSGDVSLQAAGSDQWADAPPNYPMVGGDRVFTANSSRAVLQLGGAELRLGRLTDLSLSNLTDQYEQLALAQGSVRLRVFELEPGSQIEIDTPNGAVIVQTPGDYRIDAYPQQDNSDVLVTTGSAQLTGPGLNQPLSDGYAMQMVGTSPIQLQYIDFPPSDALDAWSSTLDQRLQNSVSARYVSRQMVGFSDLDANGTWQPDTEYGPVWYPNNVPDGWRPYSTGHWAYVAPWGYTWVDDAPWGFAPFHYGRWAVVGGRWGWTPGPPRVRPVYSPALVAFVGGGPGGGSGLSIGINFGGSGGSIAAWFPIGVGEPYVPWYRCTPTYARQVNVTNVNTAVIRNTTIVNNYNTYITNTHITNTTIINNNVTNINNTNVHENHFTYANRASVTAVPVAAMSSGTSVARQQVRLSPQQQQQLAQAPISVRPTVPTPAAPHPSLVVKTNVAQPAVRPTVMTTTGQAKAVPSPQQAHPVVLSRLPAPKVVPQNAPPPVHALAPSTPSHAPNQPAPVSRPTQPAATVGLKPAPVAPQGAAPIQRPGNPSAPSAPALNNQPPSSRPIAVTPSAPVAGRPTVTPPPQPATVIRPTPPARTNELEPAAPVTRTLPAPAAPAAPAPGVRSAPPVRTNEPAPPAPVTRPLPPQRPSPSPQTQPVPETHPTRPTEVPPARPAPAPPTHTPPPVVAPQKPLPPPAKPAVVPVKPAPEKNPPEKRDPPTRDAEDKNSHPQ